MPWLGRKKIAFVPTHRPSIDSPPPDDWAEQIWRRAFYDPDERGVDRSLRSYIHTVSYGKADVDGEVLDVVLRDQQDVPVGALEEELGPSLRRRGFDLGCVVMRGGPGAGTAQPAGFWTRFVMAEGVGVWAMELTHAATGYWDLYIWNPHLGAFDNMACNCGTHPTAFTKRTLQWLDPQAIALHRGVASTYHLHALGLVQPPPVGRWAAVQVGAAAPYFIIEARQRVDPFDAGIPSEGVIVYEVASEDVDPSVIIMPQVFLRTPVALRPGETYAAPSGLTVTVTRALVAGYAVEIRRPEPEPCPAIRLQIANLHDQIDELQVSIDEVLAEMENASSEDLRVLRARLARLRAQQGALKTQVRALEQQRLALGCA